MNHVAVNAIITTRLNSTSIRDFCKQYKIHPIELSKLVVTKDQLIQSLQDLTPNYEHPEELENLETKTQPELIELLIAAGKYWREQAEN